MLTHTSTIAHLFVRVTNFVITLVYRLSSHLLVPATLAPPLLPPPAQKSILRQLLNAGVFPLYETLVAVLRVCGRTGEVEEAEKVLALTEELKLQLRPAWVAFIGGWITDKMTMK